MEKSRLIILFACLFLLLSLPALALQSTNEFSVITFRPAKGPTDSVFTHGSGVYEKSSWKITSDFWYSYQPLEITQNGTRLSGVVDDLLVQHLQASYALFDNLELGADLPVIWVNVFKQPTIPAPITNSNEGGLGDLALWAKWRFLGKPESKGGLALVGIATAPLGEESEYVGDDYPVGELRLVGDYQVSKDLRVATNVGAILRQPISLFDYDVSTQVKASVALIAMINRVKATVDAYIMTPASNMFQSETTTPGEIAAQLEIPFKDSGWSLSHGGTVGLPNAAGIPIFRTMLGVSYRPQTKKKQGLAEVLMPVESAVYFESNSAVLTQMGMETLEIFTSDLLPLGPSTRVVLSGHADPSGDVGNNIELSLQRARAVAEYLKLKGIPENQMRIEAYGEMRPATSALDDENPHLNRRVEVRVY